MVEDHILTARILMVDDEESNLELLRRILEPVGFTDLEDTADPFQVLSLCRQSPPDLVLLDIAMPGKNGFEVLAEIREHMGEEEYLPVLVLTSDHSPETKRKSLSAGAQDFLTKPLSPAEVRLRVRNLLETRFLHLALRDHNRHLEERVRERTAELEEAHAEILARLARAAEYRDDETGRAYPPGWPLVGRDCAGAGVGSGRGLPHPAGGSSSRRGEDRHPGRHPPLPGSAHAGTHDGHEVSHRDRRRPDGGERNPAPGSRGADRPDPPRAVGW